jgi:ABC-type sugar transport system ATPase subunit
MQFSLAMTIIIVMSLPLLEVRNARKRFPGVLALDGVSMTLVPGNRR